MANSGRSSWDHVIGNLRNAAAELRGAMGQRGEPSADEIAAEARLKRDLGQLQATAQQLFSGLSHEFDQQRAGFERSHDKESAARSASQMRSALDELATASARFAADLATTASASVRQAEPELKSAVRALEDVAGSASAWVRAAFEDEGDPGKHTRSGKDQPLDDL